MARARRRRMDNAVAPAAIKLNRVQDVPMKSWEGPTARSISFVNEVVTVALLAALFGALIGAGWQKDWGWMLVAGILGFFTLGGVYAVYLWRTGGPVVERVEWQDTAVQEPSQEVFASSRVVIPHPDGRGTIEFDQPAPGEFATWIRLVIRDARNGNIAFRDKIQLSQNTAQKRGWSKELYRAMLVALKSAGFVHTGPNSTPVLTNYGADAILAWLKGRA